MRRVGSGEPSPRDTLTRNARSPLARDHEIEVVDFGNAQKQRSRGEGPPAPSVCAAYRAIELTPKITGFGRRLGSLA